MASVYKAYQAKLDRHVALKVLRQEFLHDPMFAKRFEREAKVVAKLEHPNIVPIYDYGIDDGIPWMAMRMLPVGSLADLLKQGRLDRRRVVAILTQVAEALDHAHGQLQNTWVRGGARNADRPPVRAFSQSVDDGRSHEELWVHRTSNGVIHRHVKPSNVLLDDKERVYVGDFGLAHIAEASVRMATTRTGMMAGTPHYMAPEQALGKKVDHRADIYALGIVAYEMLTGAVPFSADTPVAVLMKHANEPLPIPLPDQVPEPLLQPVLKALAKDPADRWESAGAFSTALGRGLDEVVSDSTISIPERAQAVQPEPGADAARPATAPTPARPVSRQSESATTPAVEAPPQSAEPSVNVAGPGEAESRRPVVRRVAAVAAVLFALTLALALVGWLLE